MSPTEPLDQIDSTTTGPQPPRRRRGLLVAGAVVLAMAATALTGAALADVGGGGTNDETALAAASGSATPSATADTKAKRDKVKARIKGFARRGPHLPFIGGPFGALHGEFVVPDGSGGYRTVVTQRGTASDVGDDTITVKSEDGYTATYDVPAAALVGAQRDGLASIDDGDQVVVTAVKKGDTLTARMLADVDSLREHGPFGLGGPGGMGFDGRGHGPLEPDDSEGTATTPSNAT